MARYTSAKTRGSYTFDGLLNMKDGGLIAASGAAMVQGSPKVLDAGAARFQAKLVIDVTSIEAETDELFTVRVQGSNASNFGSGIATLASLALGTASATGNSANSTPGRYELGVQNIGADGTPYRYLRVFTTVAGTAVASGINYSAYFTPNVN